MIPMFIILLSINIMATDYNDLSAFDQAEKAARQEKAVGTATAEPDTTVYESEEIDNLVYISVDDTAYQAIENIQKALFRLKARLEKDKHGRKLLSFDPPDQRRYMDYLREHNLLSQPAIFALADDLLAIAQLNYESAQLIMSTQTADQRAKIFPHIKKLRADRDAARSYVIYLSRL